MTMKQAIQLSDIEFGYEEIPFKHRAKGKSYPRAFSKEKANVMVMDFAVAVTALTGRVLNSFYKLKGKREVLLGLILAIGLTPQPKIKAMTVNSLNIQTEEVKSTPFYLQTVPKVSGAVPMAQTTLGELAPVPVSAPVVTTPSASSGNLYEPGQCTWGVKNWRPDLPNNLGNADTWYQMAQEDGLSTGPTPRPNAVGQEKGAMHVVLVLAVNNDGTVLIREMNYDYVPYHVRERVAPANEYEYIY